MLMLVLTAVALCARQGGALSDTSDNGEQVKSVGDSTSGMGCICVCHLVVKNEDIIIFFSFKTRYAIG